MSEVVYGGGDSLELDALAVYSHPDDAELTCAGTLLKLKSLGRRTGVVDVIFVPTGDYQDQIPASQAFVLSKLTPMEERKSGFYDFMVEEHSKKINARYLGRVQVSPFYLWTKKEPKTLADLHGLKMRSGVLYDRFMRALGMVAVTINAPEVYTALNSGVPLSMTNNSDLSSQFGTFTRQLVGGARSEEKPQPEKKRAFLGLL